MAEKKQGAQAVVRALRILKLFNSSHQQLSVQQVVGETGLNRTTVFRLLSTLADEGFLNRRPDGDFQLGPQLAVLGGLASRRNNLRQNAHPILEKLVADVGERATLEIPVSGADGHMAMLVIDEVSAAHRLGINEFAGNHLPIYATSTGKAVMAFMSAEKQDAILQQPLEPFTAKTARRAQLEKDLAQVKKDGVALVQEELEEGLVAVGVPIFDVHGEVCGAICLAGPTVRMTAERMPRFVAMLKASAAQISASLGFRHL